uniref:Uncharacterized protein n=1 Tax=Anopheles culicifacies TaxID=139723 RepID=A0A182MLP0_9DIPT
MWDDFLENFTTTRGFTIRYISPGNSSGSYELNWPCIWFKFSSRIGNRKSAVATRFCTLKSRNFTSKPSFWIMRTNFRSPRCACCSFLAPVQMTFPERKTSAVQRGSRIRMTTPWNRDGLYSELRVRKLIVLRFSSQPTLTVATQFLYGMIVNDFTEF